MDDFLARLVVHYVFVFLDTTFVFMLSTKFLDSWDTGRDEYCLLTGSIDL